MKIWITFECLKGNDAEVLGLSRFQLKKNKFTKDQGHSTISMVYYVNPFWEREKHMFSIFNKNRFVFFSIQNNFAVYFISLLRKLKISFPMIKWKVSPFFDFVLLNKLYLQ